MAQYGRCALEPVALSYLGVVYNSINVKCILSIRYIALLLLSVTVITPPTCLPLQLWHKSPPSFILLCYWRVTFKGLLTSRCLTLKAKQCYNSQCPLTGNQALCSQFVQLYCQQATHRLFRRAFQNISFLSS